VNKLLWLLLPDDADVIICVRYGRGLLNKVKYHHHDTARAIMKKSTLSFGNYANFALRAKNT